MKFNEKLQKLRKEKKLSQEQLADQLDVSRQAVSKWESGQTYPEMDKLIMLSKIFECSLDDLTNDEISEISKEAKQKANLLSYVDDFLDMGSQTGKMIANNSVGENTKMFATMCLVFGILCLFWIPVEIISEFGSSIFYSIPFQLGLVLGKIWTFLISTVYIVFFVLIFFYVFKYCYLNKFQEEVKLEKSNDENSEIILEEKTKIQNKVSIEKREVKKNINYGGIFTILGAICIFFIKVLVLGLSSPFVLFMLFLVMAVVFWIGLLFQGVCYFGILFLLLASIVAVYIIIELAYNFIMNCKIKPKKTFLLLLISVIGLGIGFGLTVLEFADFEIVDEVPEKYELKTEIFDFIMEKELFINSYEKMTYIEDNSIDNVKVEAKYYANFTNVMLSDQSEGIYISSNNWSNFKEIYDELLRALKENKIYNYDKMYSMGIVIYANKENIETLKKNYKEYYETIKTNTLNECYNDKNDLLDKIEALENQILSFEEERILYEEEILECKEKLQEYKDRLNTMLNE